MRKVRGQRKVRRPLSRWIERPGLRPGWPKSIAIADATQRPVISAKAISPSGALSARSLPPCLNGPPARMSASGTKRTSACSLHMSAYDPKPTLAAASVAIGLH